MVVAVLDIQKGGRARELINRDDEVPTEEDEEEEVTLHQLNKKKSPISFIETLIHL